MNDSLSKWLHAAGAIGSTVGGVALVTGAHQALVIALAFTMGVCVTGAVVAWRKARRVE